MADNDPPTVSRGIAFTSLIMLFVFYVAALLFSYVDFFGRDIGPGTSTQLVFGTGTYYVLLIAIPFVLLVTLIIAGHYDASLSKGIEKAQFIYPRYQWNMWTFYSYAIITWGIVFGLLVTFMVKYGFGNGVSINSTTFNSLMVLQFKTNTMTVIISSFLMAALTLIAIYTYVVKIFEIAPQSEVEAATRKRQSMLQNKGSVNQRKRPTAKKRGKMQASAGYMRQTNESLLRQDEPFEDENDDDDDDYEDEEYDDDEEMDEDEDGIQFGMGLSNNLVQV